MWLSLLLCAEASTMTDGVMLDGVNEQYPPMVPQEALTESVDSEEEGTDKPTERLNDQTFSSSLYGHPDFERAHRLTTLGKKVRLISGPIAVGSGLMAYGAWSDAASCKGPDCGSGGLGAAVLASLGGVGYLTGTGFTLLGSYSAHSVLKTKGVEVSNAGIITSGVGVGLGSLLILDAVVLSGGTAWKRNVLLASTCTVPLGFYVQRQITKRAYMHFVDEVSLVPMWTPDTTGAVVQVQF